MSVCLSSPALPHSAVRLGASLPVLRLKPHKESGKNSYQGDLVWAAEVGRGELRRAVVVVVVVGGTSMICLPGRRRMKPCEDPAEGRKWQQEPARQTMHTGSSRVKRGNGASLAAKAGSGVKPRSPYGPNPLFFPPHFFGALVTGIEELRQGFKVLVRKREVVTS